MKILIIDSGYPINYRNVKIAGSLAKEFGKDNIEILCWNRENLPENPYAYKTYFYKKTSPFGAFFQKFINLAGFGKFIKNIMDNERYDIVIASHWEVLFLVSLYKKKKQKLVYELLDLPTNPFRRIQVVFEKIGLAKTDVISFASPFFSKLYSKYNIKKVTLENKPAETFKVIPSPQKTNDVLHISYIGILRYPETMKNLIDSVRGNDRFKLSLHGRGAILEELKEYAADCKNIIFTGSYTADRLPELYATSDIVWAAYPKDDFNALYAVSNKFYECTLFAVPGIYTLGTELGKYVEQEKIGISVDSSSADEIRKTFEKLRTNRELLKQMKESLEKRREIETLWDDDVRKFIEAIK